MSISLKKNHIFAKVIETNQFNYYFIMEQLVKNIKAEIEAISADIDKLANKAAKARVRKASLALEKLFKAYRKESVK